MLALWMRNCPGGARDILRSLQGTLVHQASVSSGSHECSRTGDEGQHSGADGAVVGPAGERRSHYLGLLLVPILSFAIANWVFGYVIVLHGESRYAFFMFGSEFLEEFLDHPGGLLEYAGRFVGQFCHYQWLGALTLSLLITCFAVLFHLVLTRLRRTVWVFHAFLPCILLLTVPQWTMGEATLGLLTVCGAFLGYLSLPRRVVRPAFTLVAIPALYFVVGGYFWLFAVWVIASEWLEGSLSSNLAFKLLYPALAVCVPLAAHRWIFLIPLSSALTYPLNLVVSSSLWTILVVPSRLWTIVLAGYMLLMPFGERISWGARRQSRRGSKRDMAVWAVLLIMLAVFLGYVSYDSELKQYLDYYQLYKRGQWDAILKKAKSNLSPSREMQFITNCALFHKGRLLEEMFNYPQVWGTRGLMLNAAGPPGHGVAGTDGGPGAMYNSDLFFEMGHVNAAFRHAHNHMTQMGRTYQNLRRLAECNVVNGNYALARKYLNILERTLFHRQFARRYKELIADSDAADTHYAELKKLLPTIEIGILRDFIPLFTLLNSNAHNRMAFDYLMAWCLLDKDSMPMIGDNMHFMKDAGYTSIPTHLQEAIMMLRMVAGINVETGGFNCDADTVSRVSAFAQQIISYRDARNQQNAQRELRGAFGGTYMYYCSFQAVPVGGDLVSAHYHLGNRLYYQGKVDLAIIQYRHALRLAPACVEAHIRLGDALVSLGEPGEAAVHYRAAVQIKPDSAEAREKLHRIRAPKTDDGG